MAIGFIELAVKACQLFQSEEMLSIDGLVVNEKRG
jgi:hypothetical protein